MVEYRVSGSLLVAAVLVLSGFGVFGYALLVAGQLLLGFIGLVVCLGVASLLLVRSR